MTLLHFLLSLLFAGTTISNNPGKDPSENLTPDSNGSEREASGETWDVAGETVAASVRETSSEETEVTPTEEASQVIETTPVPAASASTNSPTSAPDTSDETKVSTSEPAAAAPTVVESDPTPAEQQDTSNDGPVASEASSTAPAAEVEIPEQSVSVNDSSQVIEVVSGRTTTLELENPDAIRSVSILKGPEHGNVTVNPDQTLALVLSGTDHTGDLSFQYEVFYDDGTSEVHDTAVNAIQGPQSGGWGLGDFYMLQVDEDDNVIVEHGDNHREVYVSNSNSALSLEDIAAREGIDVSKINGKWLAENPEYGSSPDLALDSKAGMRLWYEISGRDAEPNSNHLLFERGYEYDNLGRLVDQASMGESELHPILVSAYGTGEKPMILSGVQITANAAQNVVFKDLAFSEDEIVILTGRNILMEDISTTGIETNIQNVERFTLRDADVLDAYRTESVKSGDGVWNQSPDRMSGIFVKNSQGILLEDTLYDHTGWGDGYDYNLSEDSPQPPSFYSHNVYIQKDSNDVTFRDNVSMRGASFGAQIRPGGFIEDNVFLDNNAGVNFNKGLDEEGGTYSGNYSFFSDNVITSGAHKTVAEKEGALTMGVNYAGRMATLLDNIVTHLANPDDPAEQEEKLIGHDALKGAIPFYNDTIVYNWTGYKNIIEETEGRSPDANIDGLDTSVLDVTTIQRFAADILNKPDATIEDLADYLRNDATNGDAESIEADDIIAFFQNGFGLNPNISTGEETLRFAPNSLGDGMRWDNRINWDQQTLPTDGNNVDLADNWVIYGGTTEIKDLDFGSGGRMFVGHGYLKTTGAISLEDHALFEIAGAGQVWSDHYGDADMLNIDISGGRFANTGEFYGATDVSVSGGQFLLATSGAAFDLSQHSHLHISGDDAKVGFDGTDNGTGVFRLQNGSILEYSAQQNELGTISEFRSGHFGDGGPNIQSGVNLGSSTLKLDISGMDGLASEHQLIEVDELIGSFEAVEMTGMGNDRDATVTIDYENDKVTFSLGSSGSGSGKTTLTTVGNANDAQANNSLWEALTDGQGTYDETRSGGYDADQDLDTLVPWH